MKLFPIVRFHVISENYIMRGSQMHFFLVKSCNKNEKLVENVAALSVESGMFHSLF